MDRAEAKDILDGYRLLLHEESDLRHAFDLAIEALGEPTVSEKESVEGDAETATTTDCISRQDAIEAIEKEIGRIRENPCAIATEGDFYYQNALKLAQEIIELQPPVTPTEQTIKEIMDFIGGMNMVDEISNEAYAKISEFVDDGTPTERTGEWVNSKGEPVDDSYAVYCSRCKAWSEYRDIYCGNCGAKMTNARAIGEEDSRGDTE